MTENQDPVQEKNVSSDKELNFRKLEAKLSQYQQQVIAEQSKREELERRMSEILQKQQPEIEDEEDEPYVDHKKLEKKLSRFAEQNKKNTQDEIQRAVQDAIRKEKKESWLKTHSDFDDIMEHAEKLYHVDPELAESILEMPQSFERQKLVYKNIKALGLHQDKAKEPTIQEKIDSNRRAPYYQPSGVGTSPYQSQANFSPDGQKQAYDKMQELKARLRL